MPPETFNWDRKEFLRDRSHERSSEPRYYSHQQPHPHHQIIRGGGYSGVGRYSGGGPRWREHNFFPNNHHPYQQTNDHHPSPRWVSDGRFRQGPSGYGKQGARHFHEAEGRGFVSSRSRDKSSVDETFRVSSSRKFIRYNRENKSVFGQKELKGHYIDAASSPNVPGKPNGMTDRPKSVDDALASNASYPRVDLAESHDDDQSQLKKQHEKNNSGKTTVGALQKSQVVEVSIGSVDWKSIKSNRSKVFSSCGSGTSYTNSSRDMEMGSMIDSKDEVQQTDVLSTQSPSFDAANSIEVPSAACESLASPSEDTSSHKKARLRWGEGLAKFEKKKVDGVDDCETSNGLVVSSGSSEEQPQVVDSTKSVDESPTVNALSDSATPVTSTADGHNSCSPGIEEKQFVKASDFEHTTANLCVSTSIVSQNIVEGSTFNLEILDRNSIACLDSAINKLLQSDYYGSGDPYFVRSTAMNKLLVWKGDMLKELEITESEIDKLEVELKSMSELEDSCSKKRSGNDDIASLNVLLDGESDVYRNPNSEVLQQVNTNSEDVESPGSATSRLVEVYFSEKDDSLNQDDCVRSSSTVLDAKRYTDKLHESIWGLNREIANEVAEEFNKLLPSKESSFDFNTATGIRCVEESSEIIKANLLRRKRFQIFNERVLALKFKALQHFWNQDVSLLSSKKNRVKSQKKLDRRLHALQNGNRKYHLSFHSRFSSSPGKLSFTPDVEIIKFVRKLISDSSQFKPLRNELKMPALTLDKKENTVTRFVSTNGLVEDPCGVEKDRSTVNLWTEEERKMFLDKYCTYGKDFTKIASLITHKTTSDCIEFYYKNHKSDFFKKASKKQVKASCPSNSYLVTSGKRLFFEADAASLDILGAASEMAANAEPKCASNLLERSSSLDAYENERETLAADVLAGICSSMSSEAMGSCITSVVDPVESYHEHTYRRKRRRLDKPEVTDIDETCSDDSNGEKTGPTDWTDEEKALFVRSVLSDGKDFDMISKCVGTRSRDQCKIFYSKTRNCLALDVVCPPPGYALLMTGNNDTCNASVEADSCICDEKSLIPESDLINETQMDGEDKIDENCEVTTTEIIPLTIIEAAHNVEVVPGNLCHSIPLSDSDKVAELKFCVYDDVDTQHLDNCCHVDDSSSGMEKKGQNGKVKLFGQILSKTL